MREYFLHWWGCKTRPILKPYGSLRRLSCTDADWNCDVLASSASDIHFQDLLPTAITGMQWLEENQPFRNSPLLFLLSTVPWLLNGSFFHSTAAATQINLQLPKDFFVDFFFPAHVFQSPLLNKYYGPLVTTWFPVEITGDNFWKDSLFS